MWTWGPYFSSGSFDIAESLSVCMEKCIAGEEKSKESTLIDYMICNLYSRIIQVLRIS